MAVRPGAGRGPSPRSTRCWSRLAQSFSRGWTNYVPGLELLLTPYERATIGNQLRSGNRDSASPATAAPDDPCAVVVCPDATGSRSGLGMRRAGPPRPEPVAGTGRIGTVIRPIGFSEID